MELLPTNNYIQARPINDYEIYSMSIYCISIYYDYVYIYIYILYILSLESKWPWNIELSHPLSLPENRRHLLTTWGSKAYQP